MRTIKFRAWDKEEKSWVADGLAMDLYYSAKVGCFMFDNDSYDLARKDIEFVQFTGLYDRNGKEIYEGDVVQIAQDLIGWFPQDTDKPIIKVVEYFMCTFLPLPQVHGVAGSGAIQIIGNIYENPELIEKP
jgi:uncharacterized phage protein (TIGR01671 family)